MLTTFNSEVTHITISGIGRHISSLTTVTVIYIWILFSKLCASQVSGALAQNCEKPAELCLLKTNIERNTYRLNDKDAQ